MIISRYLNNKNYQISIIVASNNIDQKIKRCIDSIINQKKIKFEIIIKTNLTDDNKLKILSDYKNQKNIKIINKSDKNLYDALNQATKIASGEFICFLHSDDYYANNYCLSNLYQEILNSNHYWGVARNIFLKNNKKHKKKFKKHSLFSMIISNKIDHESIIFNKNIFKKIKFDTKYHIAADYKFFLETWNKFGSPLYIDLYICVKRITDEDLSNKNQLKTLIQEKRILIELRKDIKKILIIFDLFITLLRIIKLILRKYEK